MDISQRAQTKNEPKWVLIRSGYSSGIGRRLLELMAALCVHGCHFLLRWLLSKVMRQKISWKALLGFTIADLCESLGATFIKIGQILSTRCDLLPREMIAPLVRLQDHIRPFAFSHVPTIVREQTGRPLAEIFVEFETVPISSASIASVYRARLYSGETVAVKIRRPDIVRKVHNDLRLMRAMARVLAALPVMRLIPVIEMINDLGTSIEQQLDLRIEAENSELFRQQLAAEPQVRIPVMFREYCGEAMLVMEFIDNLVRIDDLQWEEQAYQTSLKTALRVLYRMIFLNGLIHCDLHPGNLYLREDGGIVLLDTGFVTKLETSDRYQFAEFFWSITTNAGKNCARIIYETALFKPASFDQEGFELAIIDLIASSSGSKATDFQVATFAFQIFDIQRRFGLRSSNSFTMAILSLLMFEGMVKQLYPQLDFQYEARPFVLEARLQKIRAHYSSLPSQPGT